MIFKGFSRREIILFVLASFGVIIGGFHLYSQFAEESAKTKQAELVDLASKEERCKGDLMIGESRVKSSRNLSKLVNENIAHPRLSQPSAAAGFTPNSPYLLIRTVAVPLIPVDAAEKRNDFFKSLSEATNSPPPPLKVNAKSLDVQNKQAVVFSDCSDKPFVVNIKDLYEISQTVDYDNF
ncbi:MAG: hypothetical protein RMY28_021900 [Nostoc sp. ChiSLP01]|nr:hypothetical protein [Nostoc sp. CmiSLP01]MDZ8284455.1 hypothetical protein [Nostoc sp. ChiSLP01]